MRLAPRLRDTSSALSFLPVFLPRFASPLPSNQTRGQLRLPPAPHRAAAQHSTTGPADWRTLYPNASEYCSAIRRINGGGGRWRPTCDRRPGNSVRPIWEISSAPLSAPTLAGFGMARGMPLLGSVPVPGVVLARFTLTPIPLEFCPALPSPRNAKILRRVHPPSDRALGDASRETALEDVERGWLSDLRALGTERRELPAHCCAICHSGYSTTSPVRASTLLWKAAMRTVPNQSMLGPPSPEVQPRATNLATSAAGAWISPTPAGMWGSAPNRGRQHPTLPASLRA